MTNTKKQSEFCFIDNTKLKELTKECKTYIQKVLDEEKEVENIQINDVVSPELKSNNNYKSKRIIIEIFLK